MSQPIMTLGIGDLLKHADWDAETMDEWSHFDNWNGNPFSIPWDGMILC